MSEIKVIFKERYMPNPVTRVCVNMTRSQIIKTYGLDSSDIEWFKFED